MGRVLGLRCTECGARYPAQVISICSRCLAPLEVEYDWDLIQEQLSKSGFPNLNSLWRYRILLPVESHQPVDLGAGSNPLKRATKLAKELGLSQLYICDDTLNPTGSFKDRVVSVAVTKAMEFGLDAVACASTGNLAAALAAHAAKAGLPAYIFVPASIELGKILQTLIFQPKLIRISGNYDQVNRLAAELAEIFSNWGFVNINLRSYYVEGSKTLAYEVAEQLGWRAPDHVLVPMASGALLCAIHRGYKELEKLGLVDQAQTRISGAQPQACAPIANAVRENSEVLPIREYSTIVHSLAIGNPADGYRAKQVILDSGGSAAAPSDEQAIQGVKLLAKTEGIFAEPAGGVVIAGLQQLIQEGCVEKDELMVIYITGSGLKVQESMAQYLELPQPIPPEAEEFLRLHGQD